MNLLLASTFTDSLARLSGDEQKAVKTAAFDLQMNPAAPGMSFHKLDRARDKNFRSVGLSQGLRIVSRQVDRIVPQGGARLFCSPHRILRHLS